jgi:hypothetical protein
LKTLAAMVIAIGLGSGACASAQTTCLGVNCSTQADEAWETWGQNVFDGQYGFLSQTQDYSSPERRQCVDQCKLNFKLALRKCEAQFPAAERRHIDYAWMMKPAYDRCISEAQDDNYHCLGLMACPPAFGGDY